MQNLQNLALRKILGSFRIAPIGPLKIESNIPLIEICMYRKMQKYAVRTIKMIENYPIRISISIFYSSEYQSEIFDENLFDGIKMEKSTCHKQIEF